MLFAFMCNILHEGRSRKTLSYMFAFLYIGSASSEYCTLPQQ